MLYPNSDKGNRKIHNQLKLLNHLLHQSMSIWSKLIRNRKTEDTNNVIGNKTTSVSYNAENYAIVDVEVGLKDHKIHDIGALRPDGATYHKASRKELLDFLRNTDYVCGHNIIHHDAKYLFADGTYRWMLVDTLYEIGRAHV